MSTWGLRGTLAAVGVSAVVAGVGGAAIYAATGDGPHMMGMAGPGMQGPGMPGPPAHDRSGDPQGSASAPASEPGELHGEFVVADGLGGFTTVLSQTGRVTAISPSSITARSDDGYSQTYVIAALGPAADKSEPFVVDDAVTIRATRAGNVASVKTIDHARPGSGPIGPPPPVAGP